MTPNRDGLMEKIRLSSSSTHSRSLRFSFSAHEEDIRRDEANVNLFKHLTTSFCDQIELLKGNNEFLKKEVNAKNTTIEKLLDFINNVMGNNGVRVRNSENISNKSDITSTPHSIHDRYKNVTSRRSKKVKNCIIPCEQTISSDDGLNDDHTLTTTHEQSINSVVPSEQVGEEDEFEQYINGPNDEGIEKNVDKSNNNPRSPPYSEIGTESMISQLDHVNNLTFVKEDRNESNNTGLGSSNKECESDVDNNDTSDKSSPIKIGAWQAHTRGFASKEMSKYGYRGRGLGKNQDGITEPIRGEKKTSFQTHLPDSNKPASPSRKKKRDERRTSTSRKKKKDEWPEGTVLIAGDSMIGGIRESRLTKERCVKVRTHPGATVQDMGHHLTALLRKKPSYLLIHVGTNDAPDEEKRAEDIFNDIINLKSYAESLVPGIKVTISCPTIRKDENAAKVKVIHLRTLLRTAGIDIVLNGNVGVDLLGLKGLHLNQHGTRRLAKNFIEYLQCL